MIRFNEKGDFSKTINYLNNLRKRQYYSILEKYAKEGVEVLRLNTPIDTGLTSESWDYKIVVTKKGFSIEWTNSNVVDGVPVAILLQYGHATRSGNFIEGEDFINPAIRPIFEKISESIRKEVLRV